jgi:hypothetical protein
MTSSRGNLNGYPFGSFFRLCIGKWRRWEQKRHRNGRREDCPIVLCHPRGPVPEAGARGMRVLAVIVERVNYMEQPCQDDRRLVGFVPAYAISRASQNQAYRCRVYQTLPGVSQL